jgi:predicted TIM-barrel enzyme
MVEPDFEIISETLLICGGLIQSYDSNRISDLSTLARKIVAMHSMANDILSCQVNGSIHSKHDMQYMLQDRSRCCNS